MALFQQRIEVHKLLFGTARTALRKYLELGDYSVGCTSPAAAVSRQSLAAAVSPAGAAIHSSHQGSRWWCSQQKMLKADTQDWDPSARVRNRVTDSRNVAHEALSELNQC